METEVLWRFWEKFPKQRAGKYLTRTRKFARRNWEFDQRAAL